MTTNTDYRKWKRLLKLKTDDATDAACEFLECRGLRFCIDFGIDNALDKAFDILEDDWQAGR